jgi:hypothetical protein
MIGADFYEETEGSQYYCERSSFGEEMGKRELSRTPDSGRTRPTECRKPNRFGCGDWGRRSDHCLADGRSNIPSGMFAPRLDFRGSFSP